MSGGAGQGGEPIDAVDWDGLFAFVCHSLGWGWAQAEAELDLHRLSALTRHWRAQPPVHQLVAAYMQYEPPKPPAALDSAPEAQALIASLPPLQAAQPSEQAWAARHTAPV